MTAVEWLEEQIIRFHNWKLNPIYDENCFDAIELDKSIKQAKEMEKQKLEQFYNHGKWAIIEHGHGESFEDYYNQTFKQD